MHDYVSSVYIGNNEAALQDKFFKYTISQHVEPISIAFITFILNKIFKIQLILGHCLNNVKNCQCTHRTHTVILYSSTKMK